MPITKGRAYPLAVTLLRISSKLFPPRLELSFVRSMGSLCVSREGTQPVLAPDSNG